MSSNQYRLSTLMVLILDIAVLLVPLRLINPRYPWEVFELYFIEFFLFIILGFFTLMVVLGFRPRQTDRDEYNPSDRDEYNPFKKGGARDGFLGGGQSDEKR